MSEHLLEVKGLKQHFPIKTGFLKTKMLKAVDGVSFTIDAGETMGLVGESGCGKTTVGRSLLRLYKPTAGSVKFKGEEITDENIQVFRKQMQVVFQDPYSSLNPRMTVADIVGEPLDIHKLCKTEKEREEKVVHLLQLVGLNSDHKRRYAHEFSAASASASASPGPWRSTRNSSCAMSRCPPWMSPSRRRSSTPLWSFRTGSGWPTSLSRMICTWFTT